MALLFNAATAPSCLITPCPCPACCSRSSEQRCSISISRSPPPRLRPLCLWKWYSPGMPPACQDVTVFPHRSNLCACKCVFVLRWTSGWVWAGVITDWLALFIITLGCVKGSYFGLECVFPRVRLDRQHVLLCECVTAISAWAVTEMLIMWKCTSCHPYNPPLSVKKRIIDRT